MEDEHNNEQNVGLSEENAPHENPRAVLGPISYYPDDNHRIWGNPYVPQRANSPNQFQRLDEAYLENLFMKRRTILMKEIKDRIEALKEMLIRHGQVLPSQFLVSASVLTPYQVLDPSKVEEIFNLVENIDQLVSLFFSITAQSLMAKDRQFQQSLMAKDRQFEQSSRMASINARQADTRIEELENRIQDLEDKIEELEQS